MKITINEMKQMHLMQLKMLKELIKVMEELNIDYYFVHGSLLGAIRSGDFIPEDDDIDIALFRKDYNKLIEFGNEKLPKGFFIQNSLNDDYPLPFAKMRNLNSLFLQPILKNYQCNKGIYLDIFPIDFESNHPKWFVRKIQLLNFRINYRMKAETSLSRKIIQFFSLIIYPSYKFAVRKREKMFSSLKENRTCAIYSGKKTERKMPIDWFSKCEMFKFCDTIVKCPVGYKEYLTKIYGNNYFIYNPAESRIEKTGLIDISADVLKFDNQTNASSEPKQIDEHI